MLGRERKYFGLLNVPMLPIGINVSVRNSKNELWMKTFLYATLKNTNISPTKM